MPGALGEQREAVGLDLAVGLRVGVVQRAEIGAEQVQVGQRSVGSEGLVAEVLPERVGAHHVVEGTAGGRGQADLLGELPVVHFHPGVVDRRDVQLLVVGRGEVPVAVGADGGQAVAAGEVPVGLQRAAALVHADVLAAVDVDLLALRIAQRRSADQRGALPETLGGAVDHHAAVARILLVVVGDPAQAEVLVRLEQQLPARALALAAVEIVVVVDVLDVAVVAGAIGREASGEGFAERPGNRAAALEVAILPAGDLDGTLGSEGRRAGADVQHPGGGVLAEQGALRTAQQLQLLDVQQVEHGHSRTSQVDVVEVDPGAAFQAVAGGVVADAAHGDARLPRMDVGDIDAGQHLLQVLHPVDALALQGFAAEHAHRGGHILGVFHPSPRGHRDGLQGGGRLRLARLFGARGGVVGAGQLRPSGAGQADRQGQQATAERCAAGRRDGAVRGSAIHVWVLDEGVTANSVWLFIYVLYCFYGIRDCLYKKPTPSPAIAFARYFPCRKCISISASSATSSPFTRTAASSPRRWRLTFRNRPSAAASRRSNTALAAAWWTARPRTCVRPSRA